MTRLLGRNIALGILAAVAVACSANGNAKPDRLCTPGVPVFCRCANRDEGTKMCNKDAQSFEACLPCDSSGSTGAGSGGSDGLGGHGGHGSGSGKDPSDPPSTPTTPPTNPSDVDSGITMVPSTDAEAPAQPDNPKPPPDPPTPNQPDNPGASSAAHCKPLKNLAPQVEVQQIADDMPTARGGTLLDGVYVQTWAVSYTGVDGDQGAIKTTMSRETLEITGDVGRFAFSDDNGGERTGGFRLTTTGVTATIAYECPATAPADVSYDANGDDIAVYDKDANVARFFTRQKGDQQ